MQKLRTCFLATILTAASIGSALAQEPAEMNEPPAPRREIGFGTNIILGQIFDSGSAPLDLMYRWGNDKRLFRLGTSMAYNSYSSHSEDLIYKNWFSYHHVDLFFGREWRKQVAERWIVNFGGDLNLTYNGRSRQSEYSREGNEGVTILEFQENKTRRIGGGFRPFVGILFKINERLLLGTEASVMSVLQRRRDSVERYQLLNEVRNPSYADVDEELGWEFNIRTQPASNIFVYYRF